MTMPGQSPLAYQGIRETNPPQLIIQSRAPTTADFRNVHRGDIWINTSVPESYICLAISGANATWSLTSGSTTDIDTINADSGTTNGPAVTFTGANGLQTSLTGSTLTYQFTPVSSGFTGSAREWAQAGVQTTDATPTPIATIPLATNETVSVNARINGFRDDYTSALVGKLFYGARTNGGGAVEISPPIVDYLEDSAGAPSIDADVNGVDIRLLVSGLGGQTWNWVVSYDYHGVITNA